MTFTTVGMFARLALKTGTPAPLIARLNETIVKILNDPPVKEKLAGLGLVVGPVTPAELAGSGYAGLGG